MLLPIIVTLATGWHLRVAGAQRLSGSWELGDWGACDMTCGGGTQRRQLHCLDRNGHVDALQLLCGPRPVEVALERPCAETPCGFFYFGLEPWSACSAACGKGVRSRSQVCLAEGGFPASADALCAGLGAGAALGTPCNTAPCPQVRMPHDSQLEH